MRVSMNTVYRLSIIALLLATIWMIRREGERIIGGLWYPSEPLQVKVTNDDRDAVPVQVQQPASTDPMQDISRAADAARMHQQLQRWTRSDIEARAAANHVTVDEQRRMDDLYGVPSKAVPHPASAH